MHVTFAIRIEYLHYKARSVGNVIDKIKKCVRNYKVKKIAFYNDCFPDRKWVAKCANNVKSET